MKSNDMTEHEPDILFKTENNRLKKMLESQNQGKEMNIDYGINEDAYKIRILSKLIEELQKPKQGNRSSNAMQAKGHYVHSSIPEVKPDLI